MSLAEEVYKQLIVAKLREKLKGEILDSLRVLTEKAVESEKEALISELNQKLSEVEAYYEILDNMILSDDENLEAAGAYLLEKLPPK